MRVPVRPPSLAAMSLTTADGDGTAAVHRLVDLLLTDPPRTDGYPHWEQLRTRTPPDGMTHEQWWLAVKVRRSAGRRDTGLADP
jgi:hypothetical protein